MKPLRVGETIEGNLSCKKKKRDLVYLGADGNRNKYGKGGCKFGWSYTYKDKNDKMRRGCANVKSSPLVSVAAIKSVNPSFRIPVMPVKHREKKSKRKAKASSAPPRRSASDEDRTNAPRLGSSNP